jgi:pyruvate dehydrogenase E2 component (dihydrolipoamide acetyltransferase)
MAIEITMPALSPTMEEGTLSKWHVKEGDTVTSGMVIAEIETDKATMEVESIDEGVVSKILVAEGSEGVKVNTVIAVLAEEGEDASAASAPKAAEPAAKAKAAEPQDKPAPAVNPDPAPTTPKASGEKADAAATTDTRIKASPLARRIASQKGVDLSSVTGSGPHGRIIKRDVEGAMPGAAKPGQAETKPTPPASHASGAATPAASIDGVTPPPARLDPRIYAPDSYRLEPLDGMRRTVAKRLTGSFMLVPHFPLNLDLEIDALLAFRKRLNELAPEGVKISVNDLLIKAAARALIDVPECNASYSEDGIAYHKAAHVSVAVAVDGGLITPVIRNAQDIGLASIASQMKDLATRARERKLKPEEYMGGTFSISNLGMFGIKSFASILNPPEGMILSVGAGEERPVVKNGALAKATVMSVTLTCDHRVIGGAEGAKWLAAFRRYVETPETLVL